MPLDIMALVDEIAVHSGAAIGPIRQSEGRPDMRQIDHILLLTVADMPLLCPPLLIHLKPEPMVEIGAVARW